MNYFDNADFKRLREVIKIAQEQGSMLAHTQLYINSSLAASMAPAMNSLRETSKIISTMLSSVSDSLAPLREIARVHNEQMQKVQRFINNSFTMAIPQPVTEEICDVVSDVLEEIDNIGDAETQTVIADTKTELTAMVSPKKSLNMDALSIIITILLFIISTIQQSQPNAQLTLANGSLQHLVAIEEQQTQILEQILDETKQINLNLKPDTSDERISDPEPTSNVEDIGK